MDIHDLSVVMSHDILMELEKTLFQEQPVFVDIVWPYQPEFAFHMQRFLFQTEQTVDGYRTMHPMTQVFKCPRAMQDELLVHLISQSETPLHADTIECLYAVVHESQVFMQKYITWLQQQDFFSRCWKAYQFLCFDTWALYLAAFAPDFLDGPFWDRFSDDISDELVHSMSMFQLVSMS